MALTEYYNIRLAVKGVNFATSKSREKRVTYRYQITEVLRPVNPRDVIYTKARLTGRPRQTSRRKVRYIVRNARIQPNASSATIQALVEPSLGTPVPYRTIRRRLAEGHLGSRRPQRGLPLTPPFGVVPRMRKLDYSGMEPGRL
ncbi:HTH_Tnp_Tc3_2 domain-containing protein [Trichonephila clavipes]|nr:HTH_Tnp_Tc3_2 domain-containing protein [Trichonephila clavipes]